MVHVNFFIISQQSLQSLGMTHETDDYRFELIYCHTLQLRWHFIILFIDGGTRQATEQERLFCACDTFNVDDDELCINDLVKDYKVTNSGLSLVINSGICWRSINNDVTLASIFFITGHLSLHHWTLSSNRSNSTARYR